MEKNGAITDQTPAEKGESHPPNPQQSVPVQTKQAADDVESHASTRASDAVAKAAREG